MTATIPDIGDNAVVVNPVTTTVYADNGQDVVVISGKTNTVTATIPGVDEVLAVEVNPVTNTAYAGNGQGFTVSVISGKTNTVTATIPVSGAPYGVADCQASHVPLHGGIRWPHDQQVPP